VNLLVRRNIWLIVSLLFPDALIVDRTALEMRPADDGSIFIVSAAKQPAELPGITIKPRPGIGHVEGDYPFRNGVWCSSQARAYLENMRPSRARQSVARTLSRTEVEQALEKLLRNSGAEALNYLRDEIKALAVAIEMVDEAGVLDGIIGALLGTHDVELSAAAAKARGLGEPFDPARIERFEVLHDALRLRAPPLPRVLSIEEQTSPNLAFFEAYFSNFIEGTEFEVEEASDIVFKGVIPENRPADAHDVVGTYAVVSNSKEMAQLPRDFDSFVALMKQRHAVVMEGRPDKHPGAFKRVANRAGMTSFVRPEDVLGTLRRGYEIYRRLDAPLDRAIYMMFMVAEVHPFTDGNGRIARIMMNAELVAAGEARIIIPTIFRSNYLAGLRALSHGDNATTLIRSLDFAQRYVVAIKWNDFQTALNILRLTHAFMRPEEGDDIGIRLTIATAVDLDEATTRGDGAAKLK
jgi:hypothetical protein